jgi:hypothetical protein
MRCGMVCGSCVIRFVGAASNQAPFVWASAVGAVVVVALGRALLVLAPACRLHNLPQFPRPVASVLFRQRLPNLCQTLPLPHLSSILFSTRVDGASIMRLSLSTLSSFSPFQSPSSPSSSLSLRFSSFNRFSCIIS